MNTHLRLKLQLNFALVGIQLVKSAPLQQEGERGLIIATAPHPTSLGPVKVRVCLAQCTYSCSGGGGGSILGLDFLGLLLHLLLQSQLFLFARLLKLQLALLTLLY